MRILLLHPNYHSGGAEIAGNWPPAWVAYLAGAVKKVGFTDVHFIDAMTHDLSEDQVREKLEIIPGLKNIIVSEAGIGYRMDMMEEAMSAA